MAHLKSHVCLSGTPKVRFCSVIVGLSKDLNLLLELDWSVLKISSRLIMPPTLFRIINSSSYLNHADLNRLNLYFLTS